MRQDRFEKCIRTVRSIPSRRCVGVPCDQHSNLVMTAVVFGYSDPAMAFTRVDNWSLAERGQARFQSRQTHASIPDLLFRLFGGSRPRMFVAALATLVVHVALLLFLIFRLSDVKIATVKPGDSTLTLIDLSKVAPRPSSRKQPPSRPPNRQFHRMRSNPRMSSRQAWSRNGPWSKSGWPTSCR